MAKKAPRHPDRRHSKARKMETNGPRDRKLGLKNGQSILFVIKDVIRNYFFKIGV